MSANDLQIDPARRSDANPIACMSRHLIERGLGWSWTAARIDAQIRRADTLVIVARIRRQMVGFAVMRYGMSQAHLMLLAVAPAHQRRGVGRRLVCWLEESADVAGICGITLEVRANNATALRFYRGLGYEEVHVIPGYYFGREAAVRMLRILRFPDDLPVWSPPRGETAR